MKKYIFILANGAGMQTARYFSGFIMIGGRARIGIDTSNVSSGALIIDGAEKAQEVSEQILDLAPSLGIIWCPIESRTIDILS